MKWIWLLAVGCTAPPQIAAPTPRGRTCVALPAAGPHEIVGRVTDRDGTPLAAVRVDEAGGRSSTVNGVALPAGPRRPRRTGRTGSR
jgi:hypothetical protein